jgi:putative Mg2+ transporter-C (MgtC) family protein
MFLPLLTSLALLPAFDFADTLSAGLRLVAAITAGAVLGWDRERLDKPAGLRTHMMVSLGSALLMVISMRYSDVTDTSVEALRIDPTRVIAGIVGGIGFLGAGTILKGKNSVIGVTTAASIWVASAVGIACGMGYHDIALISVALAVIVLVALGRIERLIPTSPAKDADDS